MSAATALAASLVVFSAPTAGQTATVTFGTRVVTGAGRPAVDGGLHVEMAGSLQTTRTITPQGSPRVANARYVPGEVIVKFSGSSAPTSAQRTAARALGTRDVEAIAFDDAVVLKLEPEMDVEAVALATSSTRSPTIFAKRSSCLTTPCSIFSGICHSSAWSAPGTSARRPVNR